MDPLDEYLSNSKTSTHSSTSLDERVSTESLEQDPLDLYLKNNQSHALLPDDVVKAKQNEGHQDYNGYCEAFAEKVTGQPKMGGSAAEAWNNYVKKHQAFGDIQNAPAGSLIYFAPDASNEGYGHVAIADGQGNITGATYKGVATHTIADWVKQTGQKPLGFVMPGKFGGSN